MANNGRSGRSTSKNNAANDTQFSNYAYGDKAYRLEDVAIKYVDRYRNFVIVVDSPVIPKWKEAGELIAVTKYSINPDKMMAKLHQIDGFDAWWDAAKANADADAAKVATKNFIDAVKGVDDLEPEAMQAILNFNFGVVKPNGTDALMAVLVRLLRLVVFFFLLLVMKSILMSMAQRAMHLMVLMAIRLSLTLPSKLMKS